MKNKRTLTIATIIVALAILTTFGIFRNTPRTQAQDNPPPQRERISFGMVGITQGQTVRVNVVNTGLAVCPCDRVVLNFRLPNGQLVRNRNGEVIRRSVELQPGDATFLDVDYGELPNGPSRLQLRAVVTVTLPPDSTELPSNFVPTVEVINNNGRTQFAITALPAVQRVPPPVPD